MRHLVDRIVSSRIVRQADTLPGPVWALGAYGFDRAVRILPPLLSRSFWGCGSWGAAVIAAATYVVALLPLGLFVALAQRRSRALPLVSAYAGAKALASLATCGRHFFGFGSWRLFGPAGLLATVLSNLLWTAAWLALLLYIERSVRLERLFPRAGRRAMPWAAVALFVAVLLTGG